MLTMVEIYQLIQQYGLSARHSSRLLRLESKNKRDKIICPHVVYTLMVGDRSLTINNNKSTCDVKLEADKCYEENKCTRHCHVGWACVWEDIICKIIHYNLPMVDP